MTKLVAGGLVDDYLTPDLSVALTPLWPDENSKLRAPLRVGRMYRLTARGTAPNVGGDWSMKLWWGAALGTLIGYQVAIPAASLASAGSWLLDLIVSTRLVSGVASAKAEGSFTAPNGSVYLVNPNVNAIALDTDTVLTVTMFSTHAGDKALTSVVALEELNAVD